MKKFNINGVVSYNQYKLFDIMLFMVIMAALEAVNVFAIKKWFPDMTFAVSLMFTVSLIVLVRWNFLAAIFPVLHGVLYCAFLSAFQTVGVEEYITYAAGNSFILLSWFLFKLLPKEKLFSKWYYTIIYPVAGFVFVILGRSAVAACFGSNFVAYLGNTVFTESLNAAFALIALLILRRADGMLEDQKVYLKRVARERDEVKKPKDEVWAGYTELDGNELLALYGKQPMDADGAGKEEDKRDGKEKKVKEEGDGISMRDEYPPDSR